MREVEQENKRKIKRHGCARKRERERQKVKKESVVLCDRERYI